MNPSFTIDVDADDGGVWQLRVLATYGPLSRQQGEVIDHERTRRTYASAGDAITSARHLVNAWTPPQSAAGRSEAETIPNV